MKHAADVAFLERGYDDAEKLYRKALQYTSKRNMGVRRDIIEGISRSCLKSKKLEEALKWANDLVRTKKYFFFPASFFTFDYYCSTPHRTETTRTT
jgi:hypothetical protein